MVHLLSLFKGFIFFQHKSYAHMIYTYFKQLPSFLWLLKRVLKRKPLLHISGVKIVMILACYPVFIYYSLLVIFSIL